MSVETMAEELQQMNDVEEQDVQTNNDDSEDPVDSAKDHQPHDDEPRQNYRFDQPKFLKVLTILQIMRAEGITIDEGENFEEELDNFIPAVHKFHKDIYGREFIGEEVDTFRQQLTEWHTFLLIARGSPSACALSTTHSNSYITMFEYFLKEVIGRQCGEDYMRGVHFWVPCWNMYLKARQGRPPVTRTGVALTVLGVLFYLVDMVSDACTALYFGYCGQWWQCGVTLALMYASITLNAVFTAIDKRMHCAGPLGRLRYCASLLLNWPDLRQCCTLLRLELDLVRQPRTRASAVASWQQHRQRVAMLKWMEGMCEACPQAVLQLCLLLSDLQASGVSWAEWLRVGSVLVSLCSAGAALVNQGHVIRFEANVQVHVRVLVVLHLWAVPVTVSRLLSLALLLSTHLYGALAGVALHLALYFCMWAHHFGCPRTVYRVFMGYQASVLFLISPFLIISPMDSLLQRHGIHFVCNTAATVLWALTTQLGCSQPALYAAVIAFNAALMAVGLATGVAFQIWRSRTS